VELKPLEPQVVETASEIDSTKPRPMAIPKEGTQEWNRGDLRSALSQDAGLSRFTIIAKIKPGTEGEIRAITERS